jgi:hypothetical protein
MGKLIVIWEECIINNDWEVKIRAKTGGGIE